MLVNLVSYPSARSFLTTRHHCRKTGPMFIHFSNTLYTLCINWGWYGKYEYENVIPGFFLTPS